MYLTCEFVAFLTVSSDDSKFLNYCNNQLDYSDIFLQTLGIAMRNS